MDAKLIERLALESGVVDPDLSHPGVLVTDYGEATEDVQRFAALVAAECVRLCDTAHERDPDALPMDVADEIREVFGLPPRS